MKSNTKTNIKSIIIKISIAFLIIVALLTYFSGTIDNYLLPHVTNTFGGEGTLSYSLHTTATIDSHLSEDGSSLRFNFICDTAPDSFIRMGSLVDFKASIEAEENEFVYRSGTAAVVGKREVEEGIEYTAEIKEIELKDGENMPDYGDTVVIDTVFESQIYGHILMKSAIQSGKNGDYVYLVTKDKDEKRYVYQTPVTIIAESDFYAAVDMDGDLPIVLTSSKEIHDGQRVIVDD